MLVGVTWAGPDGVLGNADDFNFPAQTTDANGNYRFAAIPFGRYRITVGDAPGYVREGNGVIDMTVLGTALIADFPYRLAAAIAVALPRTGLDVVEYTVWGLFMLACGAFLLLGSRRRRT